MLLGLLVGTGLALLSGLFRIGDRSFDGRAVIENLRLDARPGEFVALLGRSGCGCGKSTVLRILAEARPSTAS